MHEKNAGLILIKHVSKAASKIQIKLKCCINSYEVLKPCGNSAFLYLF